MKSTGPAGRPRPPAISPQAGSTALSYLFVYAGYDNHELGSAVDLYWGEMTSAR